VTNHRPDTNPELVSFLRKLRVCCFGTVPDQHEVVFNYSYIFFSFSNFRFDLLHLLFFFTHIFANCCPCNLLCIYCVNGKYQDFNPEIFFVSLCNFSYVLHELHAIEKPSFKAKLSPKVQVLTMPCNARRPTLLSAELLCALHFKKSLLIFHILNKGERNLLLLLESTPLRRSAVQKLLNFYTVFKKDSCMT
jgi:hypothetical protein